MGYSGSYSGRGTGRNRWSGRRSTTCMMKPRKAGLWIVIIAAALLVGLPLLLSIAAIVALEMPPVQRFAEARVEKLLDPLFVGDVSVNGIGTNVLTALSVSTLIVRSSSSRPDSIAIKDLRISFFLPALLWNKVQIGSIRTDVLSGLITRTEEGALILPVMPEPVEPQVEPPEESPWKITISSIQIDHIQCLYRDYQTEVFAFVSEASLTGALPQLDSIDFDLLVSQAALRSQWWKGPVEKIMIRGSTGENKLTLDTLAALTGGMKITGKGTIPFSSEVNWDASAQVQGDIGTLLFLRDMAPQLARTGEISIDASARGDFAQPHIQTMVHAADIGYAGYSVDSLRLRATYDQSDTASIRAFTRGIGGNARLDGYAVIPLPADSFRIERYALDARIDNLDISRMQIPEATGEIMADAQVDMRARISGTGLETLPAYADIKARLAGPELVSGPARLSFLLDTAQWNLDFDWDRNRITGNGRIVANETITGNLAAQILEPSLISKSFTGYTIEGALYAQADMTGPLLSPRIQMNVSSPKLTWLNMNIDTLYASAEIPGSTLEIENAYAVISGRLDSALDVFDIPNAGGTVTIEANASGTLTNPSVTAELNGNNLYYEQFTLQSAQGKVSLDSLNKLRWQDLRLEKAKSSLISNGYYIMHEDSQEVQLRTRLVDLKGKEQEPGGDIIASGIIQKGRFEGIVRLEKIRIGTALLWAPVEMEAGGVLNATADIARTPAGMTGEMHFRLDNTAYQGIALGAIDGSASLRDTFVWAHADLLLYDSVPDIAVDGRIPFASPGTFEIDTSGASPFYITVRGDSIRLEELDGMMGDSLNASGGPARIDVSLRRNAAAWLIDGDIGIKTTTITYEPWNLSASGIKLASSLEGTLNTPLLTFLLSTDNIELSDQTIIRSKWKGTLHGDTVQLDTGYAYFEQGGSLKVSGMIPLSEVNKILSGGDPDLQFEFTDVPISIIEQFIPGLEIEKGVLQGGGTITLKDGRFYSTGSLRLENGVFAFEGIDTEIGPVEGRIKLAGDTMVIQSMETELGDGSIDINGWIALRPGGGLPYMNINVDADDASLEMENLALVRVESADLSMVSRDNRYLLKGNLDMGETRIIQEIWVPQLIELARPRPGAPAEPNEFLQQLDLRVNVGLERNLYIDMNLAETQLTGSVTITGTAAQPGITGFVEVVEGDIFYLDRRFDITEGFVRFYDPRELNPSLSITATTDVVTVSPSPGTEVPESETYTITLIVTGTLENPEVILNSEPPLSQPDIVSVLTLGTTLGGVSGELADRIQSLAANQLIGFGTRRLEQLLGLQDITITGDVFGTGTEAQVSLTKRISERLTLTYGTALSALGNQIVTAVYRLTGWLFLVGRAGQEGNTSIDLKVRLSW
ncbi:MAG: hypothetical protein GF401_08805 [Chitinivibrionales bacterium]|nr:hypothetical protein [Chitinivibrionales bacterium]